MKVPFRWKSGGSSRCGDVMQHRGEETGGPTKTNKKIRNENAPALVIIGKATTKDSLDTTKGSSSSSFYEESPLSSSNAKPVDMDQFCQENDEEDVSKTSDEVAIVSFSGEEEKQRASSAAMDHNDHETSSLLEAIAPAASGNDHRVSALTKAMSMKQAILTKSLELLFDDAFALVTVPHDSRPRCNDDSNDAAEEEEDDDEITALKIMQLKERAAENVKKQGHATKQFIDLIRHLEDEAMKKEAINHELQKRLKMANQLLEAEGIDAIEVNVVGPSNNNSTNQRRKRGSSRCRHDRHPHSAAHHQQEHHPRTTESMFAITEIVCSYDTDKEVLDDMTCQISEGSLALLEEEPLPPTDRQVLSSSSVAAVTDRTVTSVGSPPKATLRLQSERELLEV